MSTTIQAMAYAAYRNAGVIARPGTGQALEETAEFLLVANAMLNMWRGIGIMVPVQVRRLFPLTGAASYTIGPGGDFNVERPSQINYAGWVDTSMSPNPETPLEILSLQAWAAYRNKAFTNTQPNALYFEKTFAADRAKIYLVPIPAGGSLALYLPQIVSSLVEDPNGGGVFLPDIYQEAIEKGAAVTILGRESSRSRLTADARQQLRQDAKEAKMRIMNMNHETLLKEPEHFYGRRSNVYTGEV